MKKGLPALLLALPLLLLLNGAAAQDVGVLRGIYMKGVQALADNDLVQAEKSFLDLAELPDRKENEYYKSRSCYFLGDVYFIKQDYEKSVSYYRTVVQKYQDSDIYSRTLYKLGRTLVLQGRFEEGIAVLNDYKAKYDNTDKMADNTLYWIGRGYVGKQDYQAAIATFRLILTNYPDTALSYDVRSTIATLTKMVDDQARVRERMAGLTNDVAALRMKNEQLNRDRQMLEKMSRLLTIKERLLEIKREKIDLLEKMKGR